MPETLADLFANAQSPVVDWQGAPVFAAYEFASVPEDLTVEFIASKSSPVQGLRMKIRGGVLTVNEVETDDLLLWRDTAPDYVTVHVRARKGTRASLKVWNVWRGGMDVVQAWLGNAGMRVEESGVGQELLLRCSDGEGPPAFDDLEVRLLPS